MVIEPSLPTDEPAGAGRPSDPPMQLQWSKGERLTAELTVFLLAWAVSGLGFSLLGVMHWYTVLPATVAVWLVARLRIPRSNSPMSWWWVATFCLGISLTVFNAAFPAEHLLTGRDSGTYLATAGWLAESGGLLVDAAIPPFDEFEELLFAVPGFYQREGRDVLEPQFMHAFPAMLGSIADMDSISSAVRVNAVIGGVMLLAVFALARRFVQPAFALLAMLTLGTSLVFVYYVRAPFTEPLMALFAVSGVWLALMADEKSDTRLGFLAGAILGGTTLVRLDGIVLVFAVTAFLAVRAQMRDDLHRPLRAIRSGMLLVASVGLVESLYVSPAYVLERSSQVVPVLIGIMLTLAISDVFAARIRSAGRFVNAHKRVICSGVVVAAAVLLVYGWLIRPAVVESRGAAYGLETLQQSEGLVVDPERTYAEDSVVWITWYQGGLFLVLGFAGLVLVFRRAFLQPGERRDLLVVLVLSSFAILYFWRPSINPDHIWAMRRYLTVVIPFGAIAASVGVEWIVARTGSLSRWRGSGAFAGIAVSLALLAQPTITTLRVSDLSEFAGLANDFENSCQQIGSDAHLLIVGNSGNAFAQSFRSYCGLPTAHIAEELPPARLADLSDAVQATGSRLVVVGNDFEPGRRILRGDYEVMELTLSRPPRAIGYVNVNLGELSP